MNSIKCKTEFLLRVLVIIYHISVFVLSLEPRVKEISLKKMKSGDVGWIEQSFILLEKHL